MNTTKLGQGNIFSSVCQEFCPQGEGVPGQVPPTQADTPPREVHPLAGTPPGQLHPPHRAGTPAQAGTHPWAGTPPGQVHPHGQ